MEWPQIGANKLKILFILVIHAVLTSQIPRLLTISSLQGHPETKLSIRLQSGLYSSNAVTTSEIELLYSTTAGKYVNTTVVTEVNRLSQTLIFKVSVQSYKASILVKLLIKWTSYIIIFSFRFAFNIFNFFQGQGLFH